MSSKSVKTSQANEEVNLFNNGLENPSDAKNKNKLNSNYDKNSVKQNEIILNPANNHYVHHTQGKTKHIAFYHYCLFHLFHCYYYI